MSVKIHSFIGITFSLIALFVQVHSRSVEPQNEPIRIITDNSLPTRDDRRPETGHIESNEVLHYDDEINDDSNTTTNGTNGVHLHYNGTDALEREQEEELKPWLTRIPGVKARVTQKALDYLRDFGVDALMHEIRNLEIPVIEQNIAGMDVAITHLHVIEFNRPNATIETVPGMGLRVRLFNLHPIISADYLAELGQWVFKVKKYGSVRMTARNLQFTFDIMIGRTWDGKPEISLYDCDASGRIKFKFTGGWHETLNFGATIAEGGIRDVILAQVCYNIRKEIQKISDRGIEEFDIPTMVHDYAVDMSFVKWPKFFSESFEVYGRGELAYLDNDTDNGTMVYLNSTPPAMPVMHNHTDRMVYVYITDFTLNSILHSVYESGIIAYTITKDMIPEEARTYLSTSCPLLSLCLGTLFPQLEEQYPDGSASIHVYAAEAPHIEFVDGQAQALASANLDVSVDTPEGSHHIMTIHVNCTAALTVAISEQRFTFELIDINPQAVIAESSLGQNEGTQFFFDTIIRVATKQFLVPKIIEVGREGFEIPPLEEAQFPNAGITIDPLTPHVIVVSTDFWLDPSGF